MAAGDDGDRVDQGVAEGALDLWEDGGVEFLETGGFFGQAVELLVVGLEASQLGLIGLLPFFELLDFGLEGGHFLCVGLFEVVALVVGRGG
jgi:hypothetical protein